MRVSESWFLAYAIGKEYHIAALLIRDAIRWR
jgi:hypothetical protein